MRSSSSEVRPAVIRGSALPAGVVVAHLAVVAVSWVAAAVVGWLALRTWTGQHLDELALQEAGVVLEVLSRPRLSAALDLVPFAASVAGVSAAVVVAVRARRFTAVLIIVGIAALALASVQLLKLVVVIKPDLGIQQVVLNSFPSGHASVAAMASLTWVLVAPVSARAWVALLGAGVTTAVGVGVVLAGWHRPADVVAAILITAGWAAIAALLLRATVGPSGVRSARGLGVAMVGLGLLGLAGAFAIGLTQVSAQDTFAALVAGLLAVGATAMLTFAGLVAVARHA